MTRRTAILIGLGVPALAYPKEFWDEKDPKDWTEEERSELLTKSPWAKEPVVKYDAGPGGAAAPRNTNVRTRRGAPVTGNSGSAAPVPSHYQAVVRWESALPIREANKNKLKDDPAANYILCVTGELPMLGKQSKDESEAEFAQRLDMLKQYTKLEKKGDPIYLVRMGYANDGALFYFERNDLIRLDDKQVTFVTKLGPIDVKAKFTLREMVYKGKLEL